jgi:hypothetical protein
LARWTVSFLVLVTVTLGVGLAYAYVRYINSKSSVERLVLLPTNDLQQEGARVVSVDWAAKRVVTLQLPADVLMPLARGRGVGRVGSLTSLESGGDDKQLLIKDSFQKSLGWKIDLVLSYEHNFPDTEVGIRELVRNSLFAEVIQQRLNWWRLWALDQALKDPAFSSQQLPYTLFIERLIDVDGLVREEWSAERWDAYLTTQGIVTRLEQGRGVSVTVINTTSQSGLGTLVGRMITNNGFDVVGIKTEEEVREAGGDVIVWRNQELAGAHGALLGELFPEMKSKVENGNLSERSDVVVYAGDISQERW